MTRPIYVMQLTHAGDGVASKSQLTRHTQKVRTSGG
jgi:hypothetical protein